MDNLLNLKKQILFYISQKSVNRSLVLSGDWGAGKTHFIKNDLINFLEDSGKETIYVSLFGLDNLEQLSGNIILNSQTKMGKILSFLASRVSLNLDLPIVGLNVKHNEKKKEKLKFKPNQVLIVDDLERSKIDLLELLGYFNNLNENCNVPILLICDKHKLKIAIKNKDEYLFPKSYDERTLEPIRTKTTNEMSEIRKYWDKCICKIFNFESYIVKQHKFNIFNNMLGEAFSVLNKSKIKLISQYFMYDIGYQGNINWRMFQNSIINFNVFLDYYELNLSKLSELFIEKTILYFYFDQIYSDLTLENDYSYNHYAFAEVSIDLSVWNNIIKSINGDWEKMDKDDIIFIANKFKSFQSLTSKYAINDFIYAKNHSLKKDITLIANIHKDIDNIDATALVDVFWPMIYRLIEIRNKFTTIKEKYKIETVINSLIKVLIDKCSKEFFQSLPDIQQISPIHSRLLPLYSDENEKITDELEEIYEGLEKEFYIFVKKKLVRSFNFNDIDKSCIEIEEILDYHQLIFQKFKGHKEDDCKIKISFNEIFDIITPQDLFDKIVKTSPTNIKKLTVFLKRIKMDFYIVDFNTDFKERLLQLLTDYIDKLRSANLSELLENVEKSESINFFIDELNKVYNNSDFSNIIPSQKVVPLTKIKKK